MRKSEKQKMIAGELYLASDEELVQDRFNARLLLRKLNTAMPDDREAILSALAGLIPNAGKDMWIEPPFQCDYGYNIEAGDNVYFNFNCVVLDVTKVTIGSRTMFGPNVQIYTAMHPMDAVERASGAEYAKPIAIGEDVWVGGGTIICPGVTIGSRSVIGAGSVVTRDIPDDVFAAGNPCRVIKEIRQDNQ